jgi:hypothetical protein
VLTRPKLIRARLPESNGGSRLQGLIDALVDDAFDVGRGEPAECTALGPDDPTVVDDSASASRGVYFRHEQVVSIVGVADTQRLTKRNESAESL